MAEIVLAAPYCTPQRNTITKLMAQYGVTSARITDAYTLAADGRSGGENAHSINGEMPVRQVFHVRVVPEAAEWAEYIVLRTGKYELLSKPLEARNERWAAKWGGAMPQPWLSGDCASKAKPPPKPGDKPVKPVVLAEDSIGARLLRQLRRGGAR